MVMRGAIRWLQLFRRVRSKNFRGPESGSRKKLLCERRQLASGQVGFGAFDSVHWKKHDRRSEGLALFHHCTQIFKGSEIYSTYAQAFRRQTKNHSPKLLSRIGESNHDHGSRSEGIRNVGGHHSRMVRRVFATHRLSLADASIATGGGESSTASPSLMP